MRILQLTDAVQKKLLSSRSGRDVAAERVSARIIKDVRKRGDAALFAWTKRFDGLKLTPKNLWVSAAEMREASRQVSPQFREAVEHAARNIRAVACRQRPQEWSIEVEPGVRVDQQVSAIESVGCYVPGGRFSLVSTLLMTVIPAQEAGVKNIIVVSPQPGPAVLATAELLGVEHVARVGGAQAVAALAYGTRSMPRVDKIFGPGNRYVAAAKRLVSADCAIDLLAGPTEAVVFASNGNARFIAADLIAQAEHDPAAIAIFVTTSQQLAREVAAEIDRQLSELPKTNPAWKSLPKNGALLVAPDVESAMRFINAFGSEHLTLAGSVNGLLGQVNAAGSVFVGDWSAQPIGDYASGTNHTLPTSGAARTRGGLSVTDFVKCITVQEISQEGFRSLAPVVEELAKAEGLVAHARAVEVRK
jgi:histidinol dehydrogenase